MLRNLVRKISLPVQLVGVILFVLFFGNFLPEWFLRASYTFSMTFKELLNFCLPFIIFSFVLTGILSFKRNAPIVLAILMGMIFFSNGLVALVSFFLARWAMPFVATCPVLTPAAADALELIPYYNPSLPPLFNSAKVLMAALVIGLVVSIARTIFKGIGAQLSIHMFEYGIHRLKNFVENVVNLIFIPFLPLYVLGFLLEINHKGTFATLFSQYGATFALIVMVQIIYLAWFYLLAAGFSFSQAGRYIKNALPSYLTAFSTMSSAATIPVTLTSAKKNIDNPHLAQVAVPIMANVHLLGDSISTPILALVTLVLFKGCLPGLLSYMFFVFNFCTAMFAVSGIPGGGIMVMMPILRDQLGFTAPMESVIVALYFLLDSFGTAANVMGDGALIIMVNKILKKLRLAD